MVYSMGFDIWRPPWKYKTGSFMINNSFKLKKISGWCPEYWRVDRHCNFITMLIHFPFWRMGSVNSRNLSCIGRWKISFWSDKCSYARNYEQTFCDYISNMTDITCRWRVWRLVGIAVGMAPLWDQRKRMLWDMSEWHNRHSELLMMTSSNGNIFCVTGPLCGEFTGDRWIPLTKASDAEPWCFLWSAPE